MTRPLPAAPSPRPPSPLGASARVALALLALAFGGVVAAWAQDPPPASPPPAPLPAAPPPPAAPEDRLQVDTNEPPVPLPELPPVDEQEPLPPPPVEVPVEAPAVAPVEAPALAPPRAEAPETSEAPPVSPPDPLQEAPPAEDTGLVQLPPPPPPTSLIPLPPAPTPSLPQAVTWLVFAALSSALSDRAQRAVSGLPSRGLLPSLVHGVVLAGRICAPVFVLVGGMYLLPAAWAVAAPYALVGAALALGWTARDLLRDVLGGALLSLEGRVAPQSRVRFRGLSGVVESLDLRALTLLDDEGQLITIPNRLLMEDVIAVDPDPYAPVEVTVHLPSGVGAQHVHQVLEELALLSPYLAPSRPPHVYRDPDHKDIWIVSARLVHPRYAKEFRGALVELADEAFGVGGPRTGPGEG